jgi:hypothetical protein
LACALLSGTVTRSNNPMDAMAPVEKILSTKAAESSHHARAGTSGLLVTILICVGSCSSCVPLRFTTSPGANGRVVDAATHAPISGAEVIISHSTYPPSSPDAAFTNSRPPTVMSGEGGQFSVPLERRLDLYFVPVDIFPRFGLLVIKRQGYETTCLPFWSGSIAELGEVQLKPGQ